MWIVRNPNHLLSDTVPITQLARIGLILLTVFVALYKFLHLHSAWFVVGIIGWILCMYLLMIGNMVTTGKVKAKGAKQRRRRWLPFFYN